LTADYVKGGRQFAPPCF